MFISLFSKIFKLPLYKGNLTVIVLVHETKISTFLNLEGQNLLDLMC